MDFDAIAKEMGLKTRMVRVYVVRALLYCRSEMDEETRGD
jgi:DNA-directed RNA polymerase specialized sigma24 family protein